MKTAYKMLIGVAAISAVGYVSYKAFNGTRTEAYVPDLEDQPEPICETVDVEIATAVQTANEVVAETAAVLDQAATATVGNDTPPPAATETTASLHRQFADQLARFSRGGMTTKAGSQLEITDDSTNQTITLTRYDRHGNPIGHGMVRWNGQRFNYRTDGSFKRSRGKDLDGVSSLLLAFESAIESE